jgi:protein-S-isoprenylcysteine O-methyltransferase Ste14
MGCVYEIILTSNLDPRFNTGPRRQFDRLDEDIPVTSNSAATPTFSTAHATIAEPERTTAPSAPMSLEMIWLDVLERVIYVAIFARFAVLTIQHLLLTPSIEAFLMPISEVLPCVLIVFRKPSNALSTRPADWLFAMAGSIAPLLIKPAAVAPLLPSTICLLIMSGGIFTQITAKVVLGRSFGIVAANRGVKIAGPYRIIRHPMYAGYTITHIGLLLSMPSLLNAALYALAFSFQVVRILREEVVLMQSEDYRDFCARVRYRLLPGIF